MTGLRQERPPEDAEDIRRTTGGASVQFASSKPARDPYPLSTRSSRWSEIGLGLTTLTAPAAHMGHRSGPGLTTFLFVTPPISSVSRRRPTLTR